MVRTHCLGRRPVPPCSGFHIEASAHVAQTPPAASRQKPAHGFVRTGTGENSHSSAGKTFSRPIRTAEEYRRRTTTRLRQISGNRCRGGIGIWASISPRGIVWGVGLGVGLFAPSAGLAPLAMRFWPTGKFGIRDIVGNGPATSSALVTFVRLPYSAPR
jgi:hypothetical protein